MKNTSVKTLLFSLIFIFGATAHLQGEVAEIADSCGEEVECVPQDESDNAEPVAENGAPNESFTAIHQDFAAAANSLNREHVYETLLTNKDREEIKATVESQLQLATKMDRSGTLSSSAMQQKIYNEKFQAAMDARVKKHVDGYGILTGLFASQDNPEMKETPRAEVRDYNLSDMRISKGGFGSEFVTVTSRLFGKHVQTQAGMARACYELYNPCLEVNDVKERQKQISWFIEHPAEHEKVLELLRELKGLEKDWLAFWFLEKRDMSKVLMGTADERDSELEKFDFQDWFSKSELTMQEKLSLAINPLIAIPYFAIRAINKALEASDTGMLIKTAGELAPLEVLFPALIYGFWPQMIGGMNKLIVSINKLLLRFGQQPRPLLISQGRPHALIFSMALLGVVYFLRMRFALKKFKTLFRMHDFLIKMSKFQDVATRICEILPEGTFPELDEQLAALKKMRKDRNFRNLSIKLEADTFKGKSGWFTHYGKVLRALKTFGEYKAQFGHMMQSIGLIDCYVAAAQMIKNSPQNGNGFCLANVVDSQDAVFDCKGMWDVFIDPEQAVANDLVLGRNTEGADGGATGVLVSGPNYGGKSVFLRGMITTALLVQSFGFAPAKSITMTPFHSFDTYINVQDDPAAKESLFSAEMQRVNSLLASISAAAAKNQKVFIVADELLTGTKPKYAEALVRAILKKISGFKNVLCIFASHFDGVIHNVISDTRGAFKQMRVGAKVDAQGFYAGPTFTVMPGISPVDSALFVAERKLGQHNADIIKDAKEMLLHEQSRGK